MTNKFTAQFSENINFIYNSFDRVILRGYITSLFVEGSVINLLRNLGFNNHSNGVLKLLTDQLNSHIKKTSEKQGITMFLLFKNVNFIYVFVFMTLLLIPS